MSNVPQFTNKTALGTWIDTYISACCPQINDSSSENDKIYYNLCVNNMTHVCRHGLNGCLDEKNKCKNNFHLNAICESTTFNERGFPNYKRQHTDDLNIVPHNRTILEDWEGN